MDAPAVSPSVRQIEAHAGELVQEISQCAIVAGSQLGVTHAAEARLEVGDAGRMHVSAAAGALQFAARRRLAANLTEPLGPGLDGRRR